MNFLGHLYFSGEDLKMMTANIYGDFVRGANLSAYPIYMQDAIVLHRKIDSFIDHHPIVKNMLKELYAPLPKVAGIAVDLYFDHLLAKHWDKFSKIDLRTFLDTYYNSLDALDYDYPLEFLIMLGRMRSKDWLWHYQTIDGLNKACNGVSNRIAFKNVLNKGAEVFKKHEILITKAFFEFMTEAEKEFYQPNSKVLRKLKA